MIETRKSIQILDIHAAKAFFYIALIILLADGIYFYEPIASFFLILILFIQKRWQIQNQLFRLAAFLTLGPLLLNLSLAVFKQLLLLLFVGISSIGSDAHIEFSNVILNDFIPELLLWMMFISIGGVFGLLLLLNILFPLYNKILRIITSSIFLILMLATLFLSFMGAFIFTFVFVDFLSYIKTGQYRPVELIIDKKLHDYHVRVYRTDYEGALGSFGIQVNQEKDLPFGLRVVRNISNYYRCSDVDLKILRDNVIQVIPEFYGSNINEYLAQQYKNPENFKQRMLDNYQLPQIIFTLKPFHTTPLYRYFKNEIKN